MAIIIQLKAQRQQQMSNIITPQKSTVQARVTHNHHDLCASAKAVINIERDVISGLLDSIDEQFMQACQLMLSCKGRIVLMGMGKSGHIARKIAATLASTGSASYFIHPAEASHGDLGMLSVDDIVFFLSNSGETEEILTLIPTIKQLDIPIIAMTSRVQSRLAKQAAVHITLTIEKEACPLGLAPTSSTTAALVMGDAIAISLLEARRFKADDFAKFHPSGTLGRQLLLTVETLMHANEKMPMVTLSCLLSDALMEITRKSLGMTTVVSDSGDLQGIFTDGDLRRTLDQNHDIHSTPIHRVMTKNCITINKEMLAAEALKLMKTHKITSLVVLEYNKPVGVLHMHDLLRAGLQ